MTHHPAPGAAHLFVLAHGAGAGQRHPWMQQVAGQLVSRGVSVVTFDFPYMREGRKRPDTGAVLEDAFREVWAQAAAESGPDVALFAGGKSMGGRIASQVTAKGGLSPAPAGLVYFGYPLHPPGKPDQRRDRHLASIGAPMLFLHGTRDPFGSPEEMQDLAAGLAGATLSLVDGGDHSLQTTRRSGAAFLSVDNAVEIAANWMKQRPR